MTNSLYRALIARNAPGVHKPTQGRAAGAGLALLPLVVVLLLLALMFPRAAEPVDMPLPEVDAVRWGELEAQEAAALQRFDQVGLPAEVRALGSELRRVRTQSEEQDPIAKQLSQEKLKSTLRSVLAANDDDALLTLMRVQRRAFLQELDRCLASGIDSAELRELGGGFVAALRSAGWLTTPAELTPGAHAASKLIPSSDELRVLYKVMWVAELELEPANGFALTLDERRVLFGLFIRAPHPPEALQRRHRALRASAQLSADDCRTMADAEHRGRERWRLEKVRQLAELDPNYPRDFALGIAEYRAGEYAPATASFRRWLDAHPDGPLTLRAQNYLAYTATRQAE